MPIINFPIIDQITLSIKVQNAIATQILESRYFIIYFIDILNKNE